MFLLLFYVILCHYDMLCCGMYSMYCILYYLMSDSMSNRRVKSYVYLMYV